MEKSGIGKGNKYHNQSVEFIYKSKMAYMNVKMK